MNKITDFFRKIRGILCNPFDRDLSFLLSLWIMVSFADLYFWISYDNPVFGCYMFSHGLVMSYIVTFIVGLFEGKLKCVIKSILILLGILNVIIDTAVHSIMKCGFTNELVTVFMGTNANETREFLSMYLNTEILAIVALILIITSILYILSKHYHQKLRRFKYIGVIIVVISAGIIGLRGSKNWCGVYLMKFITMLEYQPTPDLRDYEKEHEVIYGERPSNVVFIIGESLNKKHMSLYGYERKTTPLLDSLNNTTNLLVFKNVKSIAIGTVPAFRYMMSSLTVSDNVECWLDKDFLLNIVKNVGYNTMWISNQSSSGVHDNIVARFAELSDSVYWCGKKYMGPSKVDLDEVVLNPSKSRSLEKLEKPKFTVIHLAGNHENFKSRYSDDFDHFKKDDYLECLETQRVILSQYDNSVLYNDWVVSELIKMYEDKEAIVIYLSDHSLDIYNSSEDYAGHARSTDPKSVEAGQNIPFLVYISPMYEVKFPNIVNRIKCSVEKNYYTENIMYSILDLMNVVMVNNISITDYSLFNEND